MKQVDLDTKEANNKAFAIRDVAIRSYAASTGYSAEQKLQVERMKLGLELVYRGKAFYITFRKKFATVKIDRAEVRDKHALALLEKDYEVLGITKVVSDQGVIYRLAKQ